MQRKILYTLALAVFYGFCAPAGVASSAKLEAGLAITDPDILEQLEKKGLALDALLKPGWQSGATVTPANNAALSAIPQMQDVFRVVEREMATTKRANPGAGVGMAFNHKRLFDTTFLSARDARFPLVGIVQRLDRTYRQPDKCGKSASSIASNIYARQATDWPARACL